MNTPNYPDTMTPNTPAAGTNAQSQRDFWRFDRRSIVLGLTNGVIVVATLVLVLGPLSAVLDAWPGGWGGTALTALTALALMVLGVLVIRGIEAAYDRREAERTEVSSG